ncbi:MAG: signal peptidase II [Deltaproteobacteria bacterium]|nr:signal peptidase II [Deltaproteobacteria bacterium]
MKRSRLVWTLALFVGLVAADHVTKLIAVDTLAGGPPADVISGVFDLSFHQNFGVAFNLERVLPEGARTPAVFVISALALTALGIAWWRRRHELSARTVAYAVIASGAVGNLVDRLIRGYVVDFLHLHGWPVFNVADIAIVAGVVLLVIVSFREARAEAREARAARAQAP